MASGASNEIISQVDAALAEWRQGDFVLGGDYSVFIHVANLNFPITESAIAYAEQHPKEQTAIIDAVVPGFVVISQTCDIVRSSSDRKFVEVAPLVEVDTSILHQAKKGLTPKYGYVPALSSEKLVADLDRALTIEKSCLVEQVRRQGCVSDDERRKFSIALARKRGRFAFPNDFNAMLKRLTDRIKKKHGKGSLEGKVLEQLAEIRVRAAPDWNADRVELTMMLITEDGPNPITDEEWSNQIADWQKLVTLCGRYGGFDIVRGSLDDFTARDYAESDLLDLDHLSD